MFYVLMQLFKRVTAVHLLQEKLGVILEKEDEMDCAVSGCNFLLKAVQNEAFSYENGQADFTSPGLFTPSFYIFF